MDTHRWGAVVCHRRFGKTVGAINHLQRAAMRDTKSRPRYAYIGPTYTQAKSTAWDYLKHFASPVRDHAVNESELRVDYGQNESQVRLFGADNPESLRGHYFDGVVLDEYGLMRPSVFPEVIRPALSDRGGWALFLGTPNGKNQFYETIQQAQTDDDWFYACYKASETGILTADELRDAQKAMTADEYAQEYECSFEAAVKGAVFSRELILARSKGQVTRVPYDPAMPVDTDWDLGIGDATAIWFSQTLYTGEIRLIDYYENTGRGLEHYKQVLNDRGYTYGVHWAPHDIQVRELGSGNSRLQAAHALGLHFQIAPRVEHLEDGIHAARLLFPRCWFDAEHCRQGLEALQHYRWDYNQRIHEFKPVPIHDWASHGADAFRGLAFRHYASAKHPDKVAAAAVRRAQRDWDPADRPKGTARRGGY